MSTTEPTNTETLHALLNELSLGPVAVEKIEGEFRLTCSKEEMSELRTGDTTTATSMNGGNSFPVIVTGRRWMADGTFPATDGYTYRVHAGVRTLWYQTTDAVDLGRVEAVLRETVEARARLATEARKKREKKLLKARKELDAARAEEERLQALLGRK